MKRENLIKAIVLLMTDANRLTPKDIQEKIRDRPPIISIYAALKTMIDRKQVLVRTVNGLKRYSLSKDSKGQETLVQSVRSGRDSTKYSFDGQTGLGKGRLALAVVRFYVANETPENVNEVKNIFPDSIVRPYGVIKLREEAEEISLKRRRFFVNETDVIRLVGGEEICVTNQWTSKSISTLIQIGENELKLNIQKTS